MNTNQTKVCKKCGRELPLEMFHKDNRITGGYKSSCKKCHNEYQTIRRAKIKQGYAPVIVDAPKVDESVIKECDSHNLSTIPGRLLISELRRRGYRGELEKITIEKVVI